MATATKTTNPTNNNPSTKDTTMTPGLYRLNKTIENPNGDKRVKHDWSRWAEIPEGTTLVVEDATNRLFEQHMRSLEESGFLTLFLENAGIEDPEDTERIQALWEKTNGRKIRLYVRGSEDKGNVTLDDDLAQMLAPHLEEKEYSFEDWVEDNEGLDALALLTQLVENGDVSFEAVRDAAEKVGDE